MAKDGEQTSKSAHKVSKRIVIPCTGSRTVARVGLRQKSVRYSEIATAIGLETG